MAFRRENARVHIDLSEDDFDRVLLNLGFAIGASGIPEVERLLLRVANVLNEGNPQFQQYALDDDPQRHANSPVKQGNPRNEPGPC